MTTLPLALAFLLVELVQALEYNVTVDDSDSLIQYTGANWTTSLESRGSPIHLNASLLQNGTSHSVRATDNGADFNFTGIAVWVRGALSIPPWSNWSPPNVSFTLDGVECFLSSNFSSEQHGFLYNATLFQAADLSNNPHSLSIRTYDSSPFILDSITYTATGTLINVVNSTETLVDPPASTFPYDQADDSSGSSGPHPAVVGGVVGGIFGALLLAGLVGLYIIRRSRQQAPRGSRSSRNRKSPRNAAAGGSGSGGRKRSDQEREFKKIGLGKMPPTEYNYSGPRALDVPWVPPSKDPDVHRGIGAQQSRLSTYASSAESGRTPEAYHAITTDSPHPVQPMPLEWGARSKGEKHHSMQTDGGSTLDAEGVLETVMMNNSPPPDFSTRSPTRYHGGDHPFRQT